MQLEELIVNPTAKNQYEFLKAEMLKRFNDSNSTRIWKLLESQEMGDRKQSQFYRDLKTLAGGTTKDKFLLTF